MEYNQFKMNTAPSTRSRIFDSSELVAQLEKGCIWAQIDRGRATQYAKLITDFFDGRGDRQEHVLAYHEATDIAEIYKLWSLRIDEFPGLKEKISETLKSGPLIQDNENIAASSNRPRNNAFAFFVAGRLQAAGCEVLAVDGINRIGETGLWFGDVTVRHQSLVFDIQCKRPQFSDTVERNVDKARKQILSAPVPRMGIIAIDTSVIIRPRGTLLSAQSVASASRKLTDLIQPYAETLHRENVGPEIAGLIWFGGMPCMITEPSRILRSTGERYEITRPYSAREIAVDLNHSSPHAVTLLNIGEQLNHWLRVKWN
ncbi:MAG: hypothetical protein LZF86_240114 [Nitrospira sp.]|nr:MAG: hypothetical protein LZF86_240114 [Nitrospira sp.]